MNPTAASVMLVSEGRLLVRNPGVVTSAAVLPVAADVVLRAIPRWS